MPGKGEVFLRKRLRRSQARSPAGFRIYGSALKNKKQTALSGRAFARGNSSDIPEGRLGGRADALGEGASTGKDIARRKLVRERWAFLNKTAKGLPRRAKKMKSRERNYAASQDGNLSPERDSGTETTKRKKREIRVGDAKAFRLLRRQNGSPLGRKQKGEAELHFEKKKAMGSGPPHTSEVPPGGFCLEGVGVTAWEGKWKPKDDRGEENLAAGIQRGDLRRKKQPSPMMTCVSGSVLGET